MEATAAAAPAPPPGKSFAPPTASSTAAVAVEAAEMEARATPQSTLPQEEARVAAAHAAEPAARVVRTDGKACTATTHLHTV